MLNSKGKGMNNAWDSIRHYGPLAARVLLAQLFIVSGCGKIGGFAKTAAYMAGMGLPLSNVLLTLTIALEVGGGLLLIAGWQARWIATAFFAFTLLTAVIFHPFWHTDAASFGAQLNNFMKNLAIMGGMLYVMAYGAGPLSLDARRVTSNAAPPGHAKRRHGK